MTSEQISSPGQVTMTGSSAARKSISLGKYFNLHQRNCPSSFHVSHPGVTHSLSSSDCAELISPAAHRAWPPLSRTDTHLQTRVILCLTCKLHPALPAHLHAWLSDPHQNSPALSNSGIGFTSFRCLQHRMSDVYI